MPAKTNVLSKPATNNAPKNNQPQKTTRPAHSTPNQTVFVKPEQMTRNKSNAEKPQQQTVVPKQQAPKYDVADTATVTGTEEVAYRSPQYFLFKADSLQRRYSRADYGKNIQTIINQISEAPDARKDPAVTSDKWYAAIDFNIRKPNFVVLHHTAQDNVEQTLFTFSLRRPGRESSAHYVISRDGTVYHMLNDYVRSYHAGNGKWGNITDMNSCSIGIEIDNNGNEPYSDVQIDALLKVLDQLKDKYDIPAANFIAHADVAPARKSDPSKYFPWKRLAAEGFGYWYDANNLKTPPEDFNAILALRVIGYDTRDQKAAIKAFKLHYIQDDPNPVLSDYDKKVLYTVYLKY